MNEFDMFIYRMKELTNEDPEGSHGRADAILEDLIKHLSKNLQREERDAVNFILEQYDNLIKWYA